MNKEEIRNWVVIGFNLYQDNQRRIMSKKEKDELIDAEIKKQLKEKGVKE